MRITICVLLYVLGIFYQQCFGLNFIDLPGFGSDEKAEAALMKMDKEKNKKKEDKFESSVFQDIIGSGSSNSEESDSDKQAQNKEQSLENRKSMDLSLSSPKTTQASSNSSAVTKNSTETTTSTQNTSSSRTTTTARIATSSRTTAISPTKKARPYPPVRPTATVVTIPNYRRHWLIRNQPPAPAPEKVDDKDENIKSKITMLVQQTMHDTEARMKTVQKLKDKHRDEPPYRVGFILSMIKKSRDVLNELFNVAVKHRDEWKALEQLKIFELIVHTNVDTTNLVRQLVEIHIQSLSADTVQAPATVAQAQQVTPKPAGDIGEPAIPKGRNKVVLL